MHRREASEMDEKKISRRIFCRPRNGGVFGASGSFCFTPFFSFFLHPTVTRDSFVSLALTCIFDFASGCENRFHPFFSHYEDARSAVNVPRATLPFNFAPFVNLFIVPAVRKSYFTALFVVTITT